MEREQARAKEKLKRAMQSIRQNSKGEANTAEAMDICQAAANYDQNGRINLTFDNPDDEYDIQAIQKETEARQQYKDTQNNRSTFLDQSVPRMNICILVVGTRGDVQPFIAVAKRLQRDGHRVRLATHANYREFVTGYGIEFYPLGGDPKELAEYMVRTQGHIIPLKLENLQKDVPRNRQMIDEILHSTWPAVSAPDPDAHGEGIEGDPFHAHAIISNPVSYGHIHVAERLGVPLHIMFPQPWVPTTAFPHPLANLPYTGKPMRKNYLSYKMVDLLMWQGIEGMVNHFRKHTLGLRKIRKGDGGRDILLDLAIPHSFMWSPALVPKPKDWGPLYDVIGTVTLKSGPSDYSPPPELEEFLSHEDGPIFIGFGSMVINKPVLTTQMIIEAANEANVRVLIQSSWSNMSDEVGMEIPDNVLIIGNCPHDWLMPRVSAVIHHGGAGTTAAGLLAGKPTFITPFFGDQPFWGRAVVDAGVGVEPCPISQMNKDKFRDAFEQLKDPEIRQNAENLSAIMNREDGAGGAVHAFYQHLPLDAMRCDLDCNRAATKWSKKDKMKLCDPCEYVVTSRVENSMRDVVDYHFVDYSARGPNTAWSGFSSGTGALLHEVADGVKDIVLQPKRGYREHGAAGAAIGLAKGIVGSILIHPLQGVAQLTDHVATGAYNHRRSSDQRKKGSVLMENRVLSVFGGEGSGNAPAYKATMSPDEDIYVDTSVDLSDQIAVYLSAEEKKEIEDNFQKLMASSDDEDWTLEPRMSSPSVHDAELVRSKVRVRGAHFAGGELSVEFENPDNATLSTDEMERLYDIAEDEDALRKERIDALPSQSIPKLNICLMTSGSWVENVQQYVAIGLKLQAYGHRVRIATNGAYRDRVTQVGLEFFPLEGRTSTIDKFLRFVSDKYRGDMKKKDVLHMRHHRLRRSFDAYPEKAELKELMLSLYSSCVEADPLYPGAAFRADAIISHPFLLGQTIVAERLGVPLHCMAHTPLARTQAFPHPMASSLETIDLFNYSPSHFLSYDIISKLIWIEAKDLLDDMRDHLGLLGRSIGANLLAEWKVPYTFLWNEILLSKPLDWGSEISVAGYVGRDTLTDDYHVDQPEQLDAVEDGLRLFVEKHSDMEVVFFAFMEGDRDSEMQAKLLKVVDDAASEAGVVVVLQTFVDSIDVPLRSGERVLEISRALPMTHIVPYVSAVIHWGDLSITSLCLSHGKPTCIVPGNVTQRLWGKAVHESNVGLSPIERSDLLSPDVLSNAFRGLMDPSIKEKAAEVAATYDSDVAAKQAVDSFHSNLPLRGMTCDVDPKRVARIYDPVHELKLSYEAHLVIRNLSRSSSGDHLKYKPLKYSQHHGPRFSLRQLKTESGQARRSSTASRPSDIDFHSITSEPSSAMPEPRKSWPAFEYGSSKKMFGLNRQASKAAHVIETPRFWHDKEEQARASRDINNIYEKRLLERSERSSK